MRSRIVQQTLAALLLGIVTMLGVQPAWGATLKSLQSATSVLGNGLSSISPSITPVDPTKSFLVFSVRLNNGNPDDGQISGQLTDSSTVTFQRIGTGTDVTVAWSVVEFESGVSVQRGSTPMDIAVKPVSITSVNLSRSFPIVTLRVGGTVNSNNDFIQSKLTSPTNLELSAAPRVDSVVEWQVVEHDDTIVQSGDFSFSSGDPTLNVTGLPSINPNKTWLIYNYRTEIGTQADIGQKLVRGLVTSPTSLQFDRDRTGQQIVGSWYLVEFQDATQVQHANVSFGAADLQKDVPITSIDPTRSIAVGGYLMRGGKSPFGTDDNPGVGWFTAELTSNTNLRLRRDLTGGATADLGWTVMEFGTPPITIVKKSFLTDGTPIPNGTVVPAGTTVKFLLYVNNPGAARTDISLQDVLDPAFVYQTGTIKLDNSRPRCAGAACTPVEEAAVFSAVDAQPAGSELVDGDNVSYNGGSFTIDVGDENAANAQLNIGANRIMAILFTVKM